MGRLAGGIAHDFNNLLTVIIGYSDLLSDSLTCNESAAQQVLEIKKAGDRAASFTQQLLAFSRRQIMQPRVLDLNVIVEEFDRMLRRLVGERIKVVIRCAPGLWMVSADPGETGRAIMNLSLNARDSMPDGGTLTIELMRWPCPAAQTTKGDRPRHSHQRPCFSTCATRRRPVARVLPSGSIFIGFIATAGELLTTTEYYCE